MTRRRRLLPVAVAVALLAGLDGCRRHEPSPLDRPSTLAVVDGAPISTSEFDRFAAARLGAGAAAASAEVRSALFDQLVEERILATHATGGTAPPTDDPAAIRDAVEGFLARAAEAAPPVSDAEIEAAWSGTPDRWRLPERVRLSQLIVRTPRQAAEAARRHAGGESFASLSKSLSVAPNADRGGQVGLITRGQLPPEFEQVVFRLAPGRLSAPVAAPSGIHLFLVESRESARQLSLDEARGPIRRELERSRAEDAVRRAVERALSAARVELATEHFSFRYAGRWTTGPAAAPAPLPDPGSTPSAPGGSPTPRPHA